MTPVVRFKWCLLLCCLGCGDMPISEPDAEPDAEIDAESHVEALDLPSPVPVSRAESRARALEGVRAREAAVREAFEARYPLHGISAHFLARVRAAPSPDSPIAGYMRRGTRFRATERVPGVGCRRGWFEVPGGGFVCRGDAYLIGASPPEFALAPVAPALEDPLPYDYALTRRRNVPQYWRIPTESEEEQITEMMRSLDRAPESSAPESVDAPPAPGAVDEVEARILPESLQLPDYVRQRMRPGFYVSVDGLEQDSGREFVRTVRGGYVRSSFLEGRPSSTHHGVVLGGSWRLPLAFTLRDGTHQLRRIGTTARFESAGTVSRHTAFHVAEMLDYNGSSYLVDAQGNTIRRSAVRIAAAVARPSRVRENQRWLHVSLGEQTLVAYEGDTPVYATTVSTGRQDFETPTGLFRIQSKHVSTTMDDLTTEEGAYQIEDVPWTMYFEGNYALHTAFWHDEFGRTRSHGCVNLSPSDARWVFHWAGPHLPTSWHGVFADRERVGTWVYITTD